MSFKKKVNQYGVLIVGLMIGGGFAFGGIASYAGIVGGGQSNPNSQNQFNATVPTDSYQDSSYELTSREQRILAYRNDIVFVNAFYTTEEEREQLKSIKGLEGTFNGRMFINNINYSETTLFQRYGLSDFPAAVVVGGTRGNGVSIVNDVNNESISSSSCQVMRNWRELAAFCQTS